MADEHWQEIVSDLMETIQASIPSNPELRPLLTSIINFNNKYCHGNCTGDTGKYKRGGISAVRLSKVLTCFDQAGLVVMEKGSYDRLLKAVEKQAEEIDALDNRIKRLLER